MRNLSKKIGLVSDYFSGSPGFHLTRLLLYLLSYIIKIILFLATVFTIYNRRGYTSHFTCIFLYSVILEPWDIEESYVLYTFNKVL